MRNDMKIFILLMLKVSDPGPHGPDDDAWPMEHMATSPASPGSPSSPMSPASIRRASSEKIKAKALEGI